MNAESQKETNKGIKLLNLYQLRMIKVIILNWRHFFQELRGARLHSLINFLNKKQVASAEVKAPNNIDLGSILVWHNWGSPSFQVDSHVVQGISNIGETKQIDFRCDIKEVHGFASSKSILTDFKSMDAMVEKNSQEMISSVTEENFHKNLAHGEIGIIHQNYSSDAFVVAKWDGRIFLSNAGGSHHFAAAKYIARKLGLEYELQGELYVYTLNADAIDVMTETYEIFAVSMDSQTRYALHDILTSLSVAYKLRLLPKLPIEEGYALFFSRSHPKTKAASEAFREAGILDLGDYLKRLVIEQQKFKT